MFSVRTSELQPGLPPGWYETWLAAPGSRPVRVGVVDDGIDSTHAMLASRVDTDASVDHVDGTAPLYGQDSAHATAVAGVIAAGSSSAVLVSHRIGFGPDGTLDQIVAAMSAQAALDVSNNSWGFVDLFADDQGARWFSLIADAIQTAAVDGRGGLGTVWVFAAGNARMDGDNVNAHNMMNNPHAISVGAVDPNGVAASFSTPGAAVLVSALGVNVPTTDRPGSAGYVPGDTVMVNGTSFAAPAVSAIVAEMLAVNPALGYRDVQAILALSADLTDAGSAGWTYNGAGNWNGGGMHFHHRYGFGIADARDAMRLAETWQSQNTVANLDVSHSYGWAGAAAVPDGYGACEISFTVTDSLTIERAVLSLDIAHTRIGDLVVALIAPSGMTSVLVDRPGCDPDGGSFGLSSDHLTFTFGSVAHWGEQSAGVWRVRVSDAATGDSGTLNQALLSFTGAPADPDTVHVYTDAFAMLGTGTRATFDDSTGENTLNAAAVTSPLVIDLGGTVESLVAGRTLVFAPGARVTTVIGGDGDDSLTGDGGDNALRGMWGADVISAGAGNDTVEGGAGADWLDGGAGVDLAVFGAARGDYAITTAEDGIWLTDGNGVSDWLTGFEWVAFSGGTVSMAELAPSPLHAGDDSLTTAANAALTLDAATLLGNDSGFGTLALVSVSANGAAGVLSETATGWAYSPGDSFLSLSAGDTAHDSLSYVVEDALGRRADGAVRLTITGVNDTPVTTDDTATVARAPGWQALDDLLSNDSDPDLGDTLRIVAVEQGEAGLVMLGEDGRVRYRLTDPWAASDQFTYTVEDSAGLRQSATVTVHFDAAYAAPRTGVDHVTIAEGDRAVVAFADLLANDSASTPLTFLGFDDRFTSGTCGLEACQLRIGIDTCDGFDGLGAGESRTQTLVYRMADTFGVEAPGYLRITVEGTNDAPVAVADRVSLSPGASVLLDVLANDSDADRDMLTLRQVDGAAHGDIAIIDGQVAYRADADFSGVDHFEYVIDDGHGGHATGRVSLFVSDEGPAGAMHEDGPLLAAEPIPFWEDEPALDAVDGWAMF
jgi:VCBS repeat-containing protein